ncbi:DUF4394 domain-containing protein [Lacipirellula sp.]|uniref:DUF4394 domain-containing protein n=1 Tax=Lacipirellula sp. TaxID=2691419 RepID=UPI003D098083
MRHTLLLLALALGVAQTAVAEPIVALTATNQLITFNSVSPGTLGSTVALTGLIAGDSLVGIDVRPANNTLYGFAVSAAGASPPTGRVYSINVGTGVATLAATLAADPADVTPPTPYSSVSGTYFGVDFNPVADRLRVITDTGQSLRINVATGLTQLDGAIAYAASDANAGTPAQIYASAYTNSFAGAATTTLYNLDGALSTLVTQVPPNDGTLNTVALTSLAVSPDSAFDISGQTGTAFVVLDGGTLGSINLATGVVTDLGTIGTVGAIADIAVLAIPEPTTATLVALGACALITNRRRRRC